MLKLLPAFNPGPALICIHLPGYLVNFPEVVLGQVEKRTSDLVSLHLGQQIDVLL